MRNFYLSFSMILLLTVAFFSCSEESPSEPKVTTLGEKLQQTLDKSIDDFNIKGVSASVFIPGNENWTGSGGVSHGNISITSNSIFIIGSVTKTFTSVLVLRLTEKGILSLDDSIHKWIPSFTNIDSTITIRQLLSHTSGVYDYSTHPNFWSVVGSDLNKKWTPEEILNSFINAPYFSPGSDFHYSNTGYLILGMIIKAATQSEVSTQLRNRILNPLGLSKTFLAGDETINGTFAHGWYDLTNDGNLDDVSSFPNTAFYSVSWTAGSIAASVEDLNKFSQALFTGGLINQSSLDEMLNYHSPTYSDFYNGYGLGIGSLGSVLVGGKNAVGHAGDAIGYCALMVYLPAHDASISILINEVNSNCLCSISKSFVEIIEEYY